MWNTAILSTRFQILRGSCSRLKTQKKDMKFFEIQMIFFKKPRIVAPLNSGSILWGHYLISGRAAIRENPLLLLLLFNIFSLQIRCMVKRILCTVIKMYFFCNFPPISQKSDEIFAMDMIPRVIFECFYHRSTTFQLFLDFKHDAWSRGSSA